MIHLQIQRLNNNIRAPQVHPEYRSEAALKSYEHTSLDIVKNLSNLSCNLSENLSVGQVVILKKIVIIIMYTYFCIWLIQACQTGGHLWPAGCSEVARQPVAKKYYN